MKSSSLFCFGNAFRCSHLRAATYTRFSSQAYVYIKSQTGCAMYMVTTASTFSHLNTKHPDGQKPHGLQRLIEKFPN